VTQDNPYLQPPVWPDRAPGRFAATIRTESSDGCRIVLLGLPDDLGVRLNHGRPGAVEGPVAFRQALATFGANFDARSDAPIETLVFDAGDIVPAPGADAGALEQTHERITSAVLDLQKAGMVTLCIGGGHDLTFPVVRGVSQHLGQPIGGVNIDPHLDVRETIGSGMPYRKLIEGGFVDPKCFVEFGVGRFTNSRAHVQWLNEQGGTIVLCDDILNSVQVGGGSAEKRLASVFATALPAADSIGFVSVDLDAIDGSQVSGVSSICPCGLPVSLVCEIASLAGADDRVQHFDIMEMSPPNDDPPGAGRTARIAALIFLSFVAGFSQRLSGNTP